MTVPPPLTRIEHEAFTERDSAAYEQLVRVVARDFLPFIKQTFDSLYSEERVEQLALSTPYALRHATPPSQVGAWARGIGAKPTLELRMKLDIEEISKPLRSVALEVIKEVESAGRPVLLTQQEEEEVAVATAVDPEGVGEGSVSGEIGDRAVMEGEREVEGSEEDRSTLPAHLTINKQD